MQGFVGLSEDQPLQGDMWKLHDKGYKSETEHEHENEPKMKVVSKETVKEDSNSEKAEKDESTPVKSKGIMKRQIMLTLR